jgi:hypothetical protein
VENENSFVFDQEFYSEIYIFPDTICEKSTDIRDISIEVKNCQIEAEGRYIYAHVYLLMYRYNYFHAYN